MLYVHVYVYVHVCNRHIVQRLRCLLSIFSLDNNNRVAATEINNNKKKNNNASNMHAPVLQTAAKSINYLIYEIYSKTS